MKAPDGGCGAGRACTQCLTDIGRARQYERGLCRRQNVKREYWRQMAECRRHGAIWLSSVVELRAARHESLLVMGMVIKSLNIFRQLIWQHVTQVVFTAVFDRLVIIPAFKTNHV